MVVIWFGLLSAEDIARLLPLNRNMSLQDRRCSHDIMSLSLSVYSNINP